MGNAVAAGYGEFAKDNPEALKATLVAHLRSNFFPALPAAFADVAVEALERAQEGDWQGDVYWPTDEGVLPSAALEDSDGNVFTTVAEAVEILKISAWLDNGSLDDEEE